MKHNEMIKELKAIKEWLDPPFPRHIIEEDINGCNNQIDNLIKRLRKEEKHPEPKRSCGNCDRKKHHCTSDDKKRCRDNEYVNYYLWREKQPKQTETKPTLHTVKDKSKNNPEG